MYSVHATYRGTSLRRAEYVRQVADALGNAHNVIEVRVHGPEEFTVLADDADSAAGVVMNLIQAGDFAVGIGAVLGDGGDNTDDTADAADAALRDHLVAAAARAVRGARRPGIIQARVETPGPGGVQASGLGADIAGDIAAAFTLVSHVLSRRTSEGREATALVRQGHLQSEAAEMVGISKQAMSQRLAAAGWQAEQAGWLLAVHMLARTETLHPT
ncbi:DNA-binding protein [Corynebacterium sp.]|uniref:DNA-binding protein n=1 Tax=Corynebacterium sp. TaxID=1720 RepID=UPI0028AEAB07|nr:DNA-binding protein [Corynebacterium sp.]